MQNSVVITKENLTRKNFAWQDFFRSSTADRLGLRNTTDNLAIITSLMCVADKIQQIRDLLNCPIIITSAYRSPQINKAVGGRANSQHCLGEAIDFQSSFGTPEKIVCFLRENKVEVDQCLVESAGRADWVHLSIKLRNNRNEFGELINGKFEKWQ